jgi:solute carrier family 35 (UDP-sugar transporter), member A1/2/3
VTYNLKILTGAFFSAAMLGQRLGPRKWSALMILMAGVSIVQLNKNENTSPSPVSDSIGANGGDTEQFLGFLAVFAAAVTSGFCGVYQQRILQRGGGNLWVRNAQMGVTSVVFGVGSVLLKDIDAVLEGGFFQGYCSLVSFRDELDPLMF